jgi:hypothetical protein
MRKGRLRLAIAMVAATSALLVPAASRAVIIVGSDLSLPAARAPENCILSTPPCTRLPFNYHQGNAFPRMSPASGQVTSFGIKSGAAETVTFRLGQFPGSGGGVGAGTGPTVALPGAGTFSFPASLPVKAGDIVGFDGGPTRAVSGFPGGCLNGAGYILFNPPLTDDMTEMGDSSNACEVLVNAVIVPSNKFAIGKLRLKGSAGAGTLSLKLPGPGKLTLIGKGIVKAKKSVKKAGTAKLGVRPTGSAPGMVTLKVTFSPVGGTANTEQRAVTLHG